MVMSHLWLIPPLMAVSHLQDKPLLMTVSYLWPITFRGPTKRKLVIGECSDSEESALPGASQPGSVSPVPSLPTRSEATDFSVTRSEAEIEPTDDTESDVSRRTQQVHNDKTESDLSRRAQGLHRAMRQYLNQRYYADYDPKLIHLSLLLCMKKRCAQPAEEVSAGAPRPSSG